MNNIEDKLSLLSNKIKYNQATVKDYEEYENLLINSKYFTHDEIMDRLRNANIYSYQQLINERNSTKSYEQRRTIEKVVVTGLVALGLALLIKGVNE